MKFFLAIFAILALTATPVLAADIYLSPQNKKDALPQLPSAEQPAPAPEPAPVPQQPAPAPQTAAPQGKPAAQAPQMTMDVFVKTSYQNCISQQHPIMKGPELKKFCGCVFEKVREKMTIEDIMTMTTETPAGQAQRNRLTVYGYGPCIYIPVKELLRTECQKKQEVIQKESAKGAAICKCTTDDMAKYVSENAMGVLAQRLTANPNDQDPMGSFLSSPEFNNRAHASYMACLQK